MKYPTILVLSIALLSNSAASATTWYVDPVGGGSGLLPVSPTTPWQATLWASDGDRIEFQSGSYSLPACPLCKFSINAKRLDLVCGSVGTCDYDFGPLNTNFASGAIVSVVGFNFTGTTGEITVQSSSSASFDQVSFSGLASRPIFVYGGSFAEVKNSVFYGNKHDIMVSDGNLLASNNSFSNTTNVSVFLISADVGTIVQNNLFDSVQTAIYCSGSIRQSDTTLSQNFIVDSNNGILLRGAPFLNNDRVVGNQFLRVGIGVWSGTPHATNTATIEANRFDETNYSIRLGASNDSVINNVIVQPTPAPLGSVAIESRGASHAVIAYNSINLGGEGVLLDPADASLIVNNIVVGQERGIIALGGGATIGNNNCYGNLTDRVGYAPYGLVISADPLFVGLGDLHLSAGSPMINAADSAAYSVFSDADFATRPLGFQDIGAYEY